MRADGGRHIPSNTNSIRLDHPSRPASPVAQPDTELATLPGEAAGRHHCAPTTVRVETYWVGLAGEGQGGEGEGGEGGGGEEGGDGSGVGGGRGGHRDPSDDP